LGTNRFFEAVRNLKRGGSGPQICPACGSVRIRRKPGALEGWLLPPLYQCGECGYVGRLVLELEEDGSEGVRER
jgi:predicted RNA-binding Zn-ribbon protein involved in translation (DUF1610 family)